MSAWRQTFLVMTVASLLCSVFDSHVYADTLVVPNALANTEGNDSHYPGDDFHLQQVFAASQFLTLSAPKLITQIAFRPDAGSLFFGSKSLSTRIRLSTTNKAPDELSTTFAENVGADEMIVFNDRLTTSSAFTGPESGPKDFDIVIDLTTPFYYDPSKGNLLLDLRVTGELFTMSFADAQNTLGDSISRVIGSTNGSDERTGVASTSGFVICLSFSPPLPTSLTLLGEQDSPQAIALDSFNFLAGPFSALNSSYPGSDQHTRLSLFALNLELMASENYSAVTAQAQDSQQRVFALPVEYVGTVPGLFWLTQVSVKLPDGLAAGDLKVSVGLRGTVSNQVNVAIK